MKFYIALFNAWIVKIYVIDNGGQWTHREWRVLRYLKVDAKIIPNTTSFDSIADADGIILSGGSPNVAADMDAMGNNGEYLNNFEGPIFGICAGMQFISTHFGGILGEGTVPEFGKVDLKITDHDGLFKDIPSEIAVWASHNDEVKEVPKDFVVSAFSKDCAVEGIRHKTRPIYGVQFHPEVEHTEYGVKMFENFLEAVRSFKN